MVPGGVVSRVLEPGRYVVLGGPGGYTMVRRVQRDTADGYALDQGRRVVPTAGYADRWVRLAGFKVQAGRRVTHYGVLDAVMRVWGLG